MLNIFICKDICYLIFFMSTIMFHSIYEVDKVIDEDVEGALIVETIAHLHAIEALADRTPEIHTSM